MSIASASITRNRKKFRINSKHNKTLPTIITLQLWHGIDMSSIILNQAVNYLWIAFNRIADQRSLFALSLHNREMNTNIKGFYCPVNGFYVSLPPRPSLFTLAIEIDIHRN